MSPCDRYETALSALIDGELDLVELTPAVDHLARCRSCRSFYRKSRSLEAAVLAAGAAQGAAPAPAPERVWSRIAADTGRDRAPAPQVARGRAWLPWAAVLLFGFALWVAAALSRPAGPAGGEYVEVVLEQDRGSMSEERFVDLARELLQADRRYHQKMLEVMQAVTESWQRNEGPDEGRYVGPRERSDRRAAWESPDGDGPEDSEALDRNL